MTIRLSSGTSNRCLGPSRTLSWPTQLKERSTMCSGPQLSLTGLPSAITTAWRYSVCSLGGTSPTRPGLVCFSLCPFPSPRKKNMFPVASMSIVALHPLCPEAAVGVQAGCPSLSVQDCAVWCTASPGLGFAISLLSSSLLLQLNISVYLFVSCCVHEQYKHWLCLCPLPRVCVYCLRQ